MTLIEHNFQVLYLSISVFCASILLAPLHVLTDKSLLRIIPIKNILAKSLVNYDTWIIHWVLHPGLPVLG